MDFTVFADHWVKMKESEKKDKYLDLAKELKKHEHESDDYNNSSWCSWYSHQRIGKRIRGLENKRTSETLRNYNVAEIGQNTEKSPGDLKRLAITQTQVKNPRLTLIWKTLKE